jgi:deoxyribodipyrimidine photolyase-related protein
LVSLPGDQLDAGSGSFDGFEPAHDAVWMAEVAHQSGKVASTKARSAMFLAAMRHFRDALRGPGRRVVERDRMIAWQGRFCPCTAARGRPACGTLCN